MGCVTHNAAGRGVAVEPRQKPADLWLSYHRPAGGCGPWRGNRSAFLKPFMRQALARCKRDTLDRGVRGPSDPVGRRLARGAAIDVRQDQRSFAFLRQLIIIAVNFALVFANLLLPEFNRIVDKEISYSYLNNWQFLAGSLAQWLCAGFLGIMLRPFRNSPHCAEAGP